MSLTLPSAYSNSSKLGNIQENWIAQLFHQNSYLSFDGTDDYIDLGATTDASAMCLDNSDDLTVAFWINFPTAGATEWIFANNSQTSDYSGVFVYKDSNDKISIGWGDGSGTTSGDRETMLGSTTLSTDTWYFITITTDFSLTTTNTIIRVNNSAETVSNGGTSGATNPVNESGTAYFGRRGNVYGEFKIRNFGIWAGELDSNNLTALYNSGSYFSFTANSGNYTQASALKGCWEFNNGEMNIQDQSGNGATGSVSGGVYKDFLPIALSDTTIDDVFYHGVITNKPSIRSSIDLTNSTAKTGNISLSIVNFQYKGDDFSAELFLGTRKYMNKGVRVYSQLNAESTLTNCLQVYSGRLTDISHDDSSITLQLTEQRPWDFITIPQTKSPNNIYEPVVYGNYTGNASSDFCANKTLFPVPQESLSSENCYYIAPRSLDNGSGNETSAHWYERGLDRFIPINNTVTSTLTDGNVELVIFPTIMERTFKFRPVRTKTDNNWLTPANSFDTSAVTYTHHTVSGSGAFTSTNQLLKLELGELTGLCTALTLTVAGSAAITDASSGTGEHARIRFDSYSLEEDIFTFNNDGTGTGAGTDSSSSYNNTNILTNYQNNGNILDQLIIRSFYSFGSGGSYGGTNRITDIQFLTTIDLSDPDGTASARAHANRQLLEDKNIYLACDGLTNSFVGGTGTATTGLQMHRDLLARFTNYDTADSSIYNWDTTFPLSGSLNVESARITTAWNTRWWALEPVELKKILQQAQEEFCFIFKWRADGSGSYWFVKDSYSSGDVTQTLNKDDITNLQIKNTSLSELLTKMDISYEKHPAENRYVSTQTSEDTTNNIRAKWNVLSKENIADIKLDMNVNKPGNTNPGGGDPNDGYADYYINISGDIKKIISCDIVNPAASYNLETGDIIQFSNTTGEMPVEPFGDNWADYYMITDLNRSPGKVGITAREVG